MLELKKQIARAGHVLVKEYIDDGYSGTMLDRPALEELRQDAKGDVFDAIYLQCADRIAHEVAHQTIIVGGHRAPRPGDGAGFSAIHNAYGFVMDRFFGRSGMHMEADSTGPGARRHTCPLVGSPLPAEKNAVCDGIIKRHESANEPTLFDSESMRPSQITLGRNTTSPGLKLGNKRVVFGTHPSGQLPLR